MSAAWDSSLPFALVGAGLDQCTKRIEALRPEAGVELKPVLSVPERGRVEPAHPFSAPCFACHEAGAFEYAKMFRHSGERQGKRPGEIADGRPPRGETTEDGAASGIALCAFTLRTSESEQVLTRGFLLGAYPSGCKESTNLASCAWRSLTS